MRDRQRCRGQNAETANVTPATTMNPPEALRSVRGPSRRAARPSANHGRSATRLDSMTATSSKAVASAPAEGKGAASAGKAERQKMLVVGLTRLAAKPPRIVPCADRDAAPARAPLINRAIPIRASASPPAIRTVSRMTGPAAVANGRSPSAAEAQTSFATVTPAMTRIPPETPEAAIPAEISARLWPGIRAMARFASPT